MRSFQTLVAFIFLIAFFCQQSQASRFLLKDVKTEELVVARGSPSKAETNGSEGKVHAEMSHSCGEGRVDHHEAEAPGCEHSVNPEFEDGDYIYTNSAP